MANTDVGVSATTLEALQRDFEEVIKDLGGEDNLERFRLEYEKLHRALKKSHESERRLVKKCQELSQEIMANAAKIQSAIKMSQNDHTTIEALKAEIEKAWKMVDGAHEKEARAKETIQQLKKEAATLAALVEKGAALTKGQESSLTELLAEKDELAREREALATKIGQQVHDINDKTEQMRQLESAVASRDEELRKVTSKLADLRRDFEREVKSKDRADGQVKELMQVLQARENEVQVRQASLKEKESKIEKLTNEIAAESKRQGELSAKLQKTLTDLEDTKKTIDDFNDTAAKCTAQIAQLEKDLKDRESEILQSRSDEQKAQKAKDHKLKALKKVAQERDDIRKDHEMLQRQIVGLEKQIEAIIREKAARAAEIETVEKSKSVQDKRVDKEHEKQSKIRDEIDKAEEHRKILEDELQELKREIVHRQSKVLQLEAERERFAELASEATVKFHEAQEEEKIAKMRADDLQKQIEEGGRQLVAQQSKYEQVRADRNLYSKNLIEAQDEISEMKQKSKIMEHQKEQLKEELAMKEKKLFEAVTHVKALKDKNDKLKKKTNAHREALDEATSRSESLSQEIKQLTKVINTCDAELTAQQEDFLAVTNQRDILGTQLIRRNDELALLYEKIRIQQSTLSKGEVQYRDRLVDIRMLRLKISELKRNVHMAQVRVKNIDDLKAQTTTLTRQLALERTKVQALSEELENPQNFLRWRKLDGTDPKSAEKIQKLQELQKRLITVTEQCVEKDILISEKDKLQVELKTILARQPGPEVAEQLNIYQEDLRRLNTQMKCMASELNMMASLGAEYKYESERLSRQLQEAKKQRFETKMNYQLLLQERKAGTY